MATNGDFLEQVWASHSYDFDILPNHIFDWKMQGVNCATEDYSLGSTSEILFTFETDLPISSGEPIAVASWGYGNFVFRVISVKKKKTLQNRYDVTCTNILRDAYSVNPDAIIEKSDLTNLPSNYTLKDLAIFAGGDADAWNSGQLTANNSYLVNQNWWYQGITYRQLYQWCCQLAGINDESFLAVDGSIEPNQYWNGLFCPTTPTNCCLNFNYNNTKAVDLANYQTPVVDKIWFGNDSTDVGFSFGSGEQAMMFPSNPLVNQEDTSFLSPIYNKVHALQSYTPMRLELYQRYKSIIPGKRKKKPPIYVLNGAEYDLQDFVDSYDGGEKALRFADHIWYGDNPLGYPYAPASLVIGTPTYALHYNNYLYDEVMGSDAEALSVTNIQRYIPNVPLGSYIELTSSIGTRTNSNGKHGYVLIDRDDAGFTVGRKYFEDSDSDGAFLYFTWDEFIEQTDDEYGCTYFYGIFFPNASGIPSQNRFPSSDREYSEWTEAITLSEPLLVKTYPNGDSIFNYCTLPAGTQVNVAKIRVNENNYIPEWVYPLNVQGKYVWNCLFYKIPDGSTLPIPRPDRPDLRSVYLYYVDEERVEEELANGGNDSSFSIPQLAWNYLNNVSSSYSEQATWMSYTDDDGNIYYCPIFNWEASPSGIVLEGTGNEDRRTENSYLAYDLRTQGKYVDINSAISTAETDVSGITTVVSNLNVRVGNVEASLNNKVDSNDYNGNTIISKINANGVTETINASRVDLSNYVQNSDYKGSTIISKINSATSGIIDASKVDLSGYTPPAPSYSGDDIIAKVNANGVTSTINGNRLDLSSVVSTTNYNGDTIIDKINANGVTSTINGNRVNLTTTLASVAFSGSYNDLTDVPTTPIGQVQADWAQSTPTSVDYIKNKPTNLSDFTNDEGFVSITDIGDSAERNLDSAKTTYDNALWSFEIPANKHFMVDVFAYKPSLSNSVMPTSMALLNDSGATTPIGTQNVLKEVLATSMPSSDRISFTYLGCPSVTTTYYISLKTSSAGRVGYGYKGWYM